jgi:hypothetical protein
MTDGLELTEGDALAQREAIRRALESRPGFDASLIDGAYPLDNIK